MQFNGKRLVFFFFSTNGAEVIAIDKQDKTNRQKNLIHTLNLVRRLTQFG